MCTLDNRQKKSRLHRLDKSNVVAWWSGEGIPKTGGKGCYLANLYALRRTRRAARDLDPRIRRSRVGISPKLDLDRAVVQTW